MTVICDGSTMGHIRVKHASHKMQPVAPLPVRPEPQSPESCRLCAASDVQYIVWKPSAAAAVPMCYFGVEMAW